MSDQVKRGKDVLRIVAGVGVVLAVSGAGCLSMQGQSTIDGPNNAANSTQPFVEAYVEYPGPQSKWAGPASYILHVTAKDAGLAQITVTPELTRVDAPHMEMQPDGSVTQRAPAASALSAVAAAPAVAAGAAPASSFRNMTSDEARAQLSYLANSLQGAQAPFRGCMSPVRVRLVRGNGGIVEKQGCRSELGWSRAVSETVSAFVDASTNGMQAKPSMEPARAISSETAAKPASDEVPASKP